MLEFDSQSTLTGSVAIILSLSSIPPLDHHPRSPTSRRTALGGGGGGAVFLHITSSTAARVRFRVPSRDTVLSNFDKRAPTNQDCLPKLFELPDSGGVGDQLFIFFFFFFVCDFSKKAENHFKKSGK